MKFIIQIVLLLLLISCGVSSTNQITCNKYNIDLDKNTIKLNRHTVYLNTFDSVFYFKSEKKVLAYQKLNDDLRIVGFDLCKGRRDVDEILKNREWVSANYVFDDLIQFLTKSSKGKLDLIECRFSERDIVIYDYWEGKIDVKGVKNHPDVIDLTARDVSKSKSTWKPQNTNSFKIHLVTLDDKVLGRYCYISQNRMDCFGSDQYSFEFSKAEFQKNKEVTFKFKCSYSNSWGEAKLINLSEDKIRWTITKDPEGICYAYEDVELLKV